MISSRAGSMPPITSTTRSIVGSSTTAWASRVRTPVGAGRRRARGPGCARRPAPTSRRRPVRASIVVCLPVDQLRRAPRRRCRSRARRSRTVPTLRVGLRRRRHGERGYGATVPLGPADSRAVPVDVPQRQRWERRRPATTSVEAVAVEDRALPAHLAGVDVEQPVDLGVARPPLRSHGPVPTGDLRRRGRVALRRQRDDRRGRAPRRPMTTTGRSLPCDGSSS